MAEAPSLPHLDARGHAHMIDVSDKAGTHRVAEAEAWVVMSASLVRELEGANGPKGDAIAVARLAGIAATKKTPELIPLAHPIALTHVAVDLELRPHEGCVRIVCRAENVGRTGVEMEAMTGASVCALTLYDMVKSRERGVRIERVQLLLKDGGRSGLWTRPA